MCNRNISLSIICTDSGTHSCLWEIENIFGPHYVSIQMREPVIAKRYAKLTVINIHPYT